MRVQPSARSLPGIDIALASYHRAEYDFALKASEELLPCTAAHALRSTVLRQMGRFPSALDAARMAVAAVTCDEERAVAASATATAQIANRMDAKALATLNAMNEIRASLSAQARGEIGFVRALLAYRQGDPQQAELALTEAYRDASPFNRARVLQIHGFICGLKKNYRESCKMFILALNEIEKFPSAGLHASLLFNLSFLTSELAVKVDLASMRRQLTEIPWNGYLANFRYWSHRNFGLRLALDGGVGVEIGLTLLNKSAEYALTTAQRSLVLLDAAQVSFHHGEPHNGASWLSKADEIAREVDWAHEGGDERIALLVAAEIFAEQRSDRATWYTQVCEALPPMDSMMSLSHDNRFRAMFSHTKGVVARYAGRTEEAKAYFTDALRLFKSASYQWRAAESALQLYQITGDERYRKRGQRLIRPHGESWIAEQLDPIDV